jgi:hypothetical protein
MEVKLWPNSTRPGVGLRPRRESQRPFLPQHARHCPVLEAGSSLGFMVYAPLEPHESFQVEYQGEGRYEFTYFLMSPSGKWQPLFSLAIALPLGSVGMMKETVTFKVPDPPIGREEALNVARVFFVPEDLGTPPGGISLRGATNFQTPEGWDTVYSSVLNMIERPVAPQLVVRVETDWFPQESEFRYVLQPGEGMTGTHTMPIGQVFFVPREEVSLRDCSEEEIQAIKRYREEYFRVKADHKLTTRYGLQYSPHYAQESSRAKKS